MDLLLISRCPPFPLYHGDRLIPYHVARELAARHHAIDLLAFYDNPADLADVPRYQDHFRSVTLLPEPKRSLASYWLRARFPGRRFPQRAAGSWSPAMWRAIAEKLSAHAYDAVHLFGGVHVYEYFNLVRDLPNVIVPYESFSLWLDRAVQEAPGSLPRLVKGVQRGMARRYESFMFSPYDRVVMVTDRDVAALKALDPAVPSVTIPNGVDVEYFTPTGYEPDEPALLFTGNYDYLPNLDAALRLVRDIFPRIKQAEPAARLFVVGGNPPAALRAYAADDVTITGRVPDLRPYFECSMIYVSPLRLGAGIKNKILETLAMQTPVVATPLSCDGIPVQHGRHVLMATSDDEIVRHVMALLKTPRLRQTLAQTGRQLIEEHFTWQRVADLYEELYGHIIRERQTRSALSNGFDALPGAR